MKKEEIKLEKKVEMLEQALLFYSKMKYHSRQDNIKRIIDYDNGTTAYYALLKTNPKLIAPFLDEEF